MPLFVRSKEPLSQDEIFTTLLELRHHAVVPLSNYRVSTLVHYQKWGLNIYVPGFNKEEEHLPNRFSSHGEQSAIGYGSVVMGDEKIHAVYIMAAPGDAVPDPNQKPGKSCGHCRQIMLSLAEKGVKIYVVALDGRFFPPDSFYGVEKPFLPDPFNQQDLDLQADFDSNPDSDIDPSRLQAWHILTEARNLPDEIIKEYLLTLKPHWVDKRFKTSPLEACVAECDDGYAAGVLLQDVAFLTTETSFVTVNNAIIQYGQENLSFNKIYIVSDTLDPAKLFTFDIELWRKHVKKE
ncbi:MAG: hypothetical protein K0S63_1164, partial [Gammaproteobacteria bacterium]|nr:hypothetical protein [Gammaproteobacteria bacterium]